MWKRLKSRTIVFAILLILLGVAQTVTKFIPPDWGGFVMLITGVLTWYLRELTHISINDK